MYSWIKLFNEGEWLIKKKLFYEREERFND